MTRNASSRFNVELIVRLTLAERLEQMHLQSQLFVKPGVVNHFGRLHRELFQQFLVVRAERIRAIGIHIDHAARFAVHFQRHGQFRFHAAPRRDIARVLRHIAHAHGFAVARDPAGDAFAHAQFQFGGRARQVLRRGNFQKTGSRIDQNHRAGTRVHQADGLAHDQLQRLLRIQRGMDDIAHLIEQLQPLMPLRQFGQFVAHNFLN